MLLVTPHPPDRVLRMRLMQTQPQDVAKAFALSHYELKKGEGGLR